MLLLSRFDHRVYCPLDVAGEMMSLYLEKQPGAQIMYADHHWPDEIHVRTLLETLSFFHLVMRPLPFGHLCFLHIFSSHELI